MSKIATILAVVIGLLASAAPAVAHHGAAAFDTSRTVTMKGTVTYWMWANPHCFVQYDIKNDKGEVQHWVAETSNPPDMINKGWTKDTLKVGDEISVTVYPARNGKPVGRLVHVVLANGKTLSN